MVHTFSLLEHTADIGIHVEADSLPELFVAAAEGMFQVLSERAPESLPEPKRRYAVEVEEPQLETRLVDWLNELLFIADAENVYLTRFNIVEWRGDGLRAEVAGVPYRLVPIERDIKAVTLHNLTIENENGRYRADIIFDV